ncbi:DUF4174 domain-containing protein [Psychroflexus sediminis]|uniref:DUF4174 domain-containing protein n=1 Tax=Psychroflexus sediminis TaxID=470826 RepID=A0A1G7V4N4_9FLAO|nr:DUF4174 domain-containing protein [Psychroflexus sediminis]SDG54733.1 protein of unknown function [Psychroflexus sediminis]
MKTLILIFFISLMNIPQGFNDRRIIVISSSEFTAEVKQQIDTLKEDTEELEERKLAIFTLIDGDVKAIFNSSEKSEAFIEKNKPDFKAASAPQLYLIGLDKTIKQTFRIPVQPQQVFEIVDSMPMRRAEMKRN